MERNRRDGLMLIDSWQILIPLTNYIIIIHRQIDGDWMNGKKDGWIERYIVIQVYSQIDIQIKIDRQLDIDRYIDRLIYKIDRLI